MQSMWLLVCLRLLLNYVISFYVVRVAFLSDNFLNLRKLCIAVDNKVFGVYSGSNRYIRQDYTVFNYGAFFNGAAAADYTVVNGSFNQASVGDDRIFCAAFLGIVSRA